MAFLFGQMGVTFGRLGADARKLIAAVVSYLVTSIDFTAISTLPATVTFSRSGNAMLYDSTGKLTYAPNNLLTYSNDFTNAVWTKISATITAGVTDPLGGTNASTVTATAANGQVYQGISAPAGVNYLGSMWIKRRTGSGTVKLYDATGSASQIIFCNKVVGL